MQYLSTVTYPHTYFDAGMGFLYFSHPSWGKVVRDGLAGGKVEAWV